MFGLERVEVADPRLKEWWASIPDSEMKELNRFFAAVISYMDEERSPSRLHYFRIFFPLTFKRRMG